MNSWWYNKLRSLILVLTGRVDVLEAQVLNLEANATQTEQRLAALESQMPKDQRMVTWVVQTPVEEGL